ncbi:hypothetical protein CVT24_006714 [Panaeolus cyanescens]|uniref:Uncharacterized protein n=1 Tax=Panaeolus cyanescens TaxID=181874 RepID=A0A409V9F5_9AGAR|nr:hypothetical protein CVT24_006714 [Panaeolus cyanescens]
MPGTKRAAEESAESTSRRGAKTAKTEKAAAKNGSTTKGASAKVPTVAQFKATALPLHMIISHTPPSIKPSTTPHDGVKALAKDQPEDEAVLPLGASPSPAGSESSTTTDTTGDDAGHIGSLTLVPSTFSTGSYGWKGSKRIVVELLGGECAEGGEREKVQVMLSINATVLGSKPSKSKKGEESKDEESGDTPEMTESQGEEADVSEEAV